MLERISPETMLKVKRYAYLFFIVPLVSPVVSYWMGARWDHPDLFAWGSVFFVFGIVPVLDAILGTDPANPDEERQVPEMEAQRYYRILTLAAVPAYLALIIWAAWIFNRADFGWAGEIGWIMSIGTIGGLAITVAHELIHKDEKLEQWAGGLLLSLVSYGGFKVEHIRGHHVNVSTPEDASSSRYDQSLYAFLPHAYYHNFRNAWLLEKRRLERKGERFWGPHNELIWWYLITLAVLAAFVAVFGIRGGLFFIGQSFVAFTLLEIVNYLEHYGLHRRRLANGRYERTGPEHSWNSNYFLTNTFLFHLQRHSDHHAWAKRRYQVLRHHENAPQLPAGYATMVLLALVPPLWRRVMNPRVRAYYRGEEHQLA